MKNFGRCPNRDKVNAEKRATRAILANPSKATRGIPENVVNAASVVRLERKATSGRLVHAARLVNGDCLEKKGNLDLSENAASKAHGVLVFRVSAVSRVKRVRQEKRAIKAKRDCAVNAERLANVAKKESMEKTAVKGKTDVTAWPAKTVAMVSMDVTLCRSTSCRRSIRPNLIHGGRLQRTVAGCGGLQKTQRHRLIC